MTDQAPGASGEATAAAAVDGLYRDALVRLADHVRPMFAAEAEGGKARTKRANALAELAGELRAVADRAEFGAGWSDIEEALVDAADCKAMIGRVRDLAEAARVASAAVPNSRERFAGKHAALLLLHVRWQLGMQSSATLDGDTVRDLASVVADAGRPVSDDAVRTYLRHALAAFDTHLLPPDWHNLGF